jgi:uncharacterized YigZ family protein
MGDTYRTLCGEGRSEHVAKGSRFLGWALPIQTEEEVQEALARARKAWPRANHHAYAFRLRGPGGGPLQRSSDDGEPGGTAGRPILEAILAQDLWDVLVVVSRIFGGVKLGTGGLARAYARAAREALGMASVREVQPMATAVLTVPPPLLGVVEAGLHRNGWRVLRRRMMPERAEVEIAFPLEASERVATWVREKTSGQATLGPVRRLDGEVPRR